MTRTHGRAPVGERISDNAPRNRGTVTSMIGGLTLRGGLEAMMTIEGGTDGDVFVAFLDEILGPVLRAGDLVVMDNAGAHKDPRVRSTLEKYGAKPVYLPPYSPDLNPIEHAWFVLKEHLRSQKARDIEALTSAIQTGMRLVTPAMARAFTRHCGYIAQLI